MGKEKVAYGGDKMFKKGRKRFSSKGVKVLCEVRACVDAKVCEFPTKTLGGDWLQSQKVGKGFSGRRSANSLAWG